MLKAQFKQPAIALILMLGVLAMRSPGTEAQQVSADGGGFPASSPPQSGPIDMNYECWGVGMSPYWDDYITLTVTAIVGNQAQAWNTYFDYGTVSGTVPFTFSLGQSSVSIGCEVSYYSSWTGAGSDTFSTTVGGRVPWSLTNVESEETFVYYGPGNYLRTRNYEVGDQYDLTWGFVGAIDEWYVGGAINECNITNIITAEASTNEVGRFEDKYGNHTGGPNPIPACEIPQYSDCRSEYTQYIQVQGVTFDHAVTWRCNDVQVAR